MNLRNKKSYNSEEGESERTVSRKRKALNLGKKVARNSKKAAETPKSIFASIIPENMMLVYLRRSSVQELLKDPETFNCNVLGSYIRIQSDPNDHSQKNSHQLLQVKGVKKAHGCSDEREECILLEVVPYSKEIPISMLSDEYFKKEECEDLYQRIIVGSAWRPTVMELQRKAQILHKVITKQWLAKELSLIRSIIDRDNETGWCATEKGWRKELFEYLERTVPLQKPAGQEGILLTVPNVIAEDPEPEFTVQKSAEDKKNDICCSPKLTIAGTSTAEQEGILLPVPNVIAEDLEPESSVQKSAEDKKNDICCSLILTIAGTSAEDLEPESSVQKSAEDEKNDICCSPILTIAGTSAEDPEPKFTVQKSAEDEKNDICCSPKLTIVGTLTAAQEGILLPVPNVIAEDPEPIAGTSAGVANKSKEPVIIDISDDDDQQGVDDPNIALWYYEDVKQVTQGPVPARRLKEWKEEGFFWPGFRVWKIGQPPVLLDNMLSQMFPSYRG